MCVILIGKVNKSMHQLALAQNGDGFSVFTAKGLIKAPTLAEVKEAHKEFAIWHYRIATSGLRDTDNIHPFEICNGKYLLYHNGILGNGLGNKSDTAALADTLRHVDIKTADSVIQSLSSRNRFVIASKNDPTSFRLYGQWEAEEGVLMSHKMYKSPVYKGYPTLAGYTYEKGDEVDGEEIITPRTIYSRK